MMHWSSTSTDKTAWSANPSSNCLQGGSIVVTFTGLCVTSTCMHVGRLNRRQLRQTTGFWQHWRCSSMLSELFTSPFGVFNDLIVLFFLSLEIGGERILRKFTSGIFYIFRWFSSTCLKITKYENPLFLSLLFLPRSYREREPCHFFFVRAHQKNMKESWALLSEFLTDNSQLRHSLATSRGGKSSFVQSRGYETQTTARTTKQARNQWIGQENGPVNQTDKCQFSIRSIGA